MRRLVFYDNRYQAVRTDAEPEFGWLLVVGLRGRTGAVAIPTSAIVTVLRA